MALASTRPSRKPCFYRSRLPDSWSATKRGSFTSFFSEIPDAFHVLFDPFAYHFEGFFLRFGGHLRQFAHVTERLFETLFGEIRPLLHGIFLAGIGNHFLHGFLEDFCLPTDEALPTLESNPIRFGESFDVLPFAVYKCCKVDAWQSELAHKFGEVKKRHLAGGALFSRFAVIGHDVSPSRVGRTSSRVGRGKADLRLPGILSSCQRPELFRSFKVGMSLAVRNEQRDSLMNADQANPPPKYLLWSEVPAGVQARDLHRLRSVASNASWRRRTFCPGSSRGSEQVEPRLANVCLPKVQQDSTAHHRKYRD